MRVSSPTDQALQRLGVRRFILQVHDASFPGAADEDVGRGTPYGAAGVRFMEFARSLGFTGIQLGPQGQTGIDNASPYDSTAFSRNFLSISFTRLREDPEWARLVDRDALDAALARAGAAGDPGERTHYRLAWESQAQLCEHAYRRFGEECDSGRIDARPIRRFARENAWWLEPDALYEVLSQAYGTQEWRSWQGAESTIDRRLYCPSAADRARTRRRRAELLREHRDAVERYALIQFLAHHQHQQVHRHARQIGLALYADLQVGLELRDVWRLQPLFLPGYLLGAPPSRTNREGQPWGYPILDPDRYHVDGDVGSGTGYLRARTEKLFTEFDGVRIDHPQGLVCPWIYRADDPDPFRAVRTGARLLSSPNLADHPSLQRYAIAAASQIADAGGVERYADDWVRDLTSEQVDRHATLLSVIIESARRHGVDAGAIACETLSTRPYPLRKVTEKFGVGRFRVTQKMDVHDPDDVYRTENAVAPDWVMLGNHDTPPIRARVAEWQATGEIGDRAAYLARQLAPPAEADALRRTMCSNPGVMVQAMVADLLVSRAENVAVFFADLLGTSERYNSPGTVGPENWNLRVPRNYRGTYECDAREYRAINIPYACSLALKSPLLPRA